MLLLSDYAHDFVVWLEADEPLVRAYTACILANIAFLEPGQQKVLDAGGIPPLVAMLKDRNDKKVTLHSTAAVQNLTYKNTYCCQEVLEQGGERALKKLLQVGREPCVRVAVAPRGRQMGLSEGRPPKSAGMDSRDPLGLKTRILTQAPPPEWRQVAC